MDDAIRNLVTDERFSIIDFSSISPI
jgi:hypothetical protein